MAAVDPRRDTSYCVSSVRYSCPRNAAHISGEGLFYRAALRKLCVTSGKKHWVLRTVWGIRGIIAVSVEDSVMNGLSCSSTIPCRTKHLQPHQSSPYQIFPPLRSWVTIPLWLVWPHEGLTSWMSGWGCDLHPPKHTVTRTPYAAHGGGDCDKYLRQALWLKMTFLFSVASDSNRTPRLKFVMAAALARQSKS